MFNHRSYFDPTVMGLLFATAERNVRGLGKKEGFDVPIIGRLLRGIGGVRLERVPVIPVGLWGTELVWPRSSKLPDFSPFNRLAVTATVGPPVSLKYHRPGTDTAGH